MVPQPKKIWPTLVALAAVAFAIKNPEQAAHAVNQVMTSAFAFMGALG
ncbi:hypothetical protein ACQPZ8_38040 [Actinomadura nitritigenes]